MVHSDSPGCPRTIMGGVYPIWPASIEPERNAWNAVPGSMEMEMAPKVDERTKPEIRCLCMLRDAAEPGVPREGLVTAVGEEDTRGGTNYRKGYLLLYGVLLCAIGDDSRRQPRTPSGKQS